MLPRTQVPPVLAPCRLRHARTFHRGIAVTSEQAQPSNNQRRYTGRTGYRGPTVLSEEPNSAILRGKKFLQSPAEALAVIRAVERKYGAVKEYKFQRDFELPTHYQNSINVTFRDPKAFERIPVETETILVTLPTTIRNRPGGVGLDELEPVLRSEEYKESNIPTFGNVMEDIAESGKEETAFTIQRSSTNWFTAPLVGTLPPSEDVARSFIRWGGFHELPPVSTDTLISQTKVFLPSAVDNARMRCALRTYSEALRIPNPYETLSTTAPDISRPTLDWEPLPGHESAPTDTPMPSTIQTFVSSVPASPGPDFQPNASTSTQNFVDIMQDSPLPGVRTSTSIPASVAEVEAIAASMAKPPSRPKQTMSPERKKPQRQRQAQGQKNSQHSMRDLRDQSLRARQQESAKRSQKQRESEPSTVKDKISNFFSNIF